MSAKLVRHGCRVKYNIGRTIREGVVVAERDAGKGGMYYWVSSEGGKVLVHEKYVTVWLDEPKPVDVKKRKVQDNSPTLFDMTRYGG